MSIYEIWIFFCKVDLPDLHGMAIFTCQMTSKAAEEAVLRWAAPPAEYMASHSSFRRTSCGQNPRFCGELDGVCKRRYAAALWKLLCCSEESFVCGRIHSLWTFRKVQKLVVSSFFYGSSDDS